MKRRSLPWSVAIAVALPIACSRPVGESPSPKEPIPSASTALPSASASAAAAGDAAAGDAAASDAAASDVGTVEPTSPYARDAATFRKLVTELSEPDANFFSDNYVSNETSYLQVAPILPRETAPDGAYLGVGPEQNFTYIALTKPRFAYIIDIRRDNMLLHLLYKALFDQAESRSDFLALLIGRKHADDAPGPTATIEQVLAHAEKIPASEAQYNTIHRQVLRRIEQTYGMKLSDADRQTLARTHRAFFDDGLDLHFTLKEKSFRSYPPLREILAQTDPDGKQTGFLASEDDFRYVQRMQRDNRIVPLVGDFAGDRTMPALAKHLESEGVKVSSFYVSNVEQYLLQAGVWWKWQRNIAALPIDGRSGFIRAYLNQGRPHPFEMAGHRTTTTLQRMADFVARKEPYPSLLALASDRAIP